MSSSTSHEIIVTRPGTHMMTAYRKAPDRPNLVLTRSWFEPTVSSPAISEFRAHAFQAAVAEARDLGWIDGGPIVSCPCLPPFSFRSARSR